MTAVCALDVRADERVAHGLTNEDLPCGGERLDAGTDMDRDARVVVAVVLDRAEVQTSSYLEIEQSACKDETLHHWPLPSHPSPASRVIIRQAAGRTAQQTSQFPHHARTPCPT